MNKFKFKIEKITKLEKAKTIVVDGTLMDGKILTGSSASLEHDQTKSKIIIKGITIGESNPKVSNILSIVIDLPKNKEVISLMKEGDFLIGN